MDASVGGVWVSPSTAEAFISGSWRSLSYAEAYIGGAWRTIANFTPPAPPPPSGGGGGGGGGGGSLTLTASPTSLSGVGVWPRPATTGNVTITPSGGLAPYTYSWATSTTPFGSAAASPAYATTKFTCAMDGPGDTSTGTAICTVTDSLGVTASITISLSFHAT